MKHKWLTRATLLTVILLLSLLAPLSTIVVKAQEEATIRIINPLSGDNKFIFNIADFPVNTTFTVEFYIENVTALLSWQIFIKWNNTIIHFQKGWIPDNNVFAEAIDQGATLIAPPPSVEIVEDTGYLKYGASILPLTPVNVPDSALLCKLNFTIAIEPQDSQEFTNIELIPKEEGSTSLDTFVILKKDSSRTPIPVYAQPAIVRILKEEISIIRDLAIHLLKVEPSIVDAGDTLTITLVLINFGNDLETANITIRYNETILINFEQSLGANQNFIKEKTWNTTGVKPGLYIISVDIAILPGETNTTNNHAENMVIINKKLEIQEYIVWILILWLNTPLGILAITYTLIFIGIFTLLSIRKKLKVIRSKL
ncbi:MAG: hypothetical protein QXL57_00965 [Candidatus Bathyarchaeia archaeon]